MSENEKITIRNEIIDALKKDYQKRVGEIPLTVMILGQGFPEGKDCWGVAYSESCEICDREDCIGPKRRIKIKRVIEEYLYDFAIIPEELEFIHPAIDQKLILMDKEIDLVIIFPEGPGSIAEFSEYSNKPEIAYKLRVFVPKKYHPFEMDIDESNQGYLTNAYLFYLTVYGHVYSFDDDQELIKKVVLLLESYKRVKYGRKYLK